MKPNSKVRQALAESMQGFEHLKTAASILSCGPSSYYLDKLDGYVEALFDTFAPFKEGDRVELTRAPDCTGHWSGSEHFLIPGAKGTVQEVDYTKGRGFVADVVFDDESWIDMNGVVQPRSNSHTYHIGEKLLRKLDAEPTKEVGE